MMTDEEAKLEALDAEPPMNEEECSAFRAGWNAALKHRDDRIAMGMLWLRQMYNQRVRTADARGGIGASMAHDTLAWINGGPVITSAPPIEADIEAGNKWVADLHSEY